MTAAALPLAGRTCVVTGAAGGIGAAEAEELAAGGATVLCADVTAPDATVAAIRAAGGNAAGWCGDLTAAGAAEAVVEAAHALGGAVDVVVNNAGAVRDRMLVNLADADWDAVLAVNLTVPFRLTRAVFRLWRAAGPATGRRVINTTSESGLYGNAGQANYAAAKAGLVGLTLTAAAEGERLGACVNAVAPRARTAMSEAAFGGLPADGRLSPRRVARAVAWLASPDATGVTGQVLLVHGDTVALLHGWDVRRAGADPAAVFDGVDGRNVPSPIRDLFAAGEVHGA